MTKLTRRELLKSVVLGQNPFEDPVDQGGNLEGRVDKLERDVDGLNRGRTYVYGSLGELRNRMTDQEQKTAKTPWYQYQSKKSGEV